MQVYALPIAGILFGLLYMAWSLVWMARPDMKNYVFKEISPVFLVLTVIGIIVVHEMLHAICHPGFGLRKDSILGFWPSKFLFFAHYEQELARNRFILILVFPFLVISLVPLVLGFWVSRDWWYWWAFVSCFNGAAACGDWFGILIVLFQVPRQGIVRNQGYRTFWRL